MICFIKSFRTFEYKKTLHAVDWDVVVRSVADDVSTVIVPKGEADAGDKGEWLIAAGALLRIETVQPGTETTVLKCRDLPSVFDRDLILSELSAQETVNTFIMSVLNRQFANVDDAHYAMTYLHVTAESTGDIAFHAPEVNGYGLFNFASYLRSMARTHNIHLTWSDYGHSGLLISVGRGEVRGGQLVLGAGDAQLAEAPVFANADTARITVIQPYTTEDEEESYTKTDFYLYADGTYGNDATSAERVDGGWSHLGVAENDSAADVSDKVAQVFARGLSDSKVSFYSSRDFTVGAPVNLRVEGRKYSGYISRKAVKSTDKRFLYQCGNLPVTLTDRVQRAEEATEKADKTSGGSSGSSSSTSKVQVKDGDSVVATLYKTSDGRGVLALRDTAHEEVNAVQAYALSSGAGGIITRNANGKNAVTLAASASGMQSNAGAAIAYDASGTARATLGVGTGGGGVLRLKDASGNAYDLTPALISKLINS